MEETLDLKEVFFVIKNRWKFIVICTLIGAIIAFVVSAFFVTKKYTSSVNMYVNNTTTISNGNVNINDLNASQKLVDTYIVILQNDEVLSQISNELGSISVSSLRKAITLTSVNDTEVLHIAAETDNPQLSASICNTMAKIAPSVLKRVVKAGSAEVIGTAVPASSPSSPNVKRNALIGAILGIVIAVGITLVLFFLDNTIKGEEDVKLHLNIPVLGEIPSFDGIGKERSKHVL